MEDVALIFVTMDRPDAAQRFVCSIRERFPDLPVHVADQTEPTAFMRAFYERHRVNVLWMPHDSGVCECRNALVAATTSEYLFLCDDDLIFTPDTDYSGALRVLERDPEVGIVGGRWLDRYDEGPDQVRQWALFLHLDAKNEMLIGVPAYHYFPIARHAGVHKYFLCDTALNFALFRRAVFDEPSVRWDPRFKCNGEHEDFYLNFKTASPYKVAYYPGLVCLHSRPRAAAYEKLRERSDGWLRFMQKWGIKQYCELDNGTRTVAEPDKAHRQRNWSDYLRGFGLTWELEFGNDAYQVSLTDDWQVIRANHYDPKTAAPLRYERSKTSLYLNARGELLSAGGESDVVPDDDERRALALEELRRCREHVEVRFATPLAAPAGDELLLLVQVENRAGRALRVGQNSLVPAKFSVRLIRDGSYAARWDDTVPCYADVPLEGHEQVLRVQAPPEPGSYQLEVALVVADAFVLGRPVVAFIEATDPTSRTESTPSFAVFVESAAPSTGAPFAGPDTALVGWIRDHVTMAPVGALGQTGSLLPVAVTCSGEASEAPPELLLTCHWKKDGRYLAWDVERHAFMGLRAGRHVRGVRVARPLDPSVEIEVAAVVPSAGYVSLFTTAGT
jgi:hypothetical protein